MIKKKTIIGAGLSLLVIFGAVMVSSSSVLAEGTDNSLGARFKGVKAGFFGGNAPDKAVIQEKVNSKLSELVTGGTITQAEADKVVEYFSKYFSKDQNTGDKVNPLEQMVTDGILTQEKADAVAKVLPVKQRGVKGEFIRPKLDFSGLVSAGTLTQAEADKVVEYFDKYRSKEQNIGDKVNPLEQLVKDGVINQEKADAIAKALPLKNRALKGVFHGSKFDFSSLVSTGTITQAEADKVTEYLKNFHQNKDLNANEKINPFEQMVKDGILTQEKADQIVEELSQKMPKREHGMIEKEKSVSNET